MPRFFCSIIVLCGAGKDNLQLKVAPDTNIGKKKWVILERVLLVEIVDLISQEFGDVINVVEFIATDATHLAVLAVEKVI